MATDTKPALAYLYEPIEPLYRFIERRLSSRGVMVRRLEAGPPPLSEGILVCELDESSGSWIAARKGKRCLAICAPSSSEILDKAISNGLSCFLERPFRGNSLDAQFDALARSADGTN